jgi:hypothetical protein
MDDEIIDQLVENVLHNDYDPDADPIHPSRSAIPPTDSSPGTWTGRGNGPASSPTRPTVLVQREVEGSLICVSELRFLICAQCTGI